PSDVISRLITDLLMESPGKLRPTATGIFDPGSFLISRMSTNPAQAPVLLSDRLNRNAQTQLAPFIPQLFAMLCFNRNSRGSGGGLDSSHVLANDGALGILRRFAQCAPELVVFYAVVSHKSLPKASRGGYFVEQLLSLFDPSMVADIRLFLLLAGDIAVLPQEQLRRACIKAKTVHRRAVSALIQGTSADAQVAVDESLRPVYKVIGEFAGKETAQSPVVTEFMARIPRLKLLVDRLGSRSVDMTRAAGCLRDFEAVWSEIFKATSLASSLAIGYISPRLMEFRASIPIPSLTDPMEPFYYAQIGGAMRVIGSKTRPKLISLQLGNAAGEISRHKYILKGSEDLRIDECVMQGFVRLNRVLAGGGSVGGSGRGGCLAVYNVVPIDTYGGLLQVVDNAPSLFHLYSKHAALKLAFESSRQSDDRQQQQQQQPVAMPAVPVGFHQVYMGHAQEVLARFGLPALLPIDKWPHGVFVAVYEALVEHGSGVSDGLLYNHLLRAAQSSSHLFLTMQNMVRSIAIASVAGYIFGLGDRHLDNLLVDAAAGQLVHVDFNVCFDFGSVSQIPEQVPFRMSPALSYLCGMPLSSGNKDEGGVVGAFSFGRVFESTARSVLKCARMDRRCLVDAVVGRCLFRPFMEWCWMEESRYREEQRRGSR
ncbi:Serine/threonine-protein kinase smg1, partial [Coemansia sp. RSA 2599]